MEIRNLKIRMLMVEVDKMPDTSLSDTTEGTESLTSHRSENKLAAKCLAKIDEAGRVRQAVLLTLLVLQLLLVWWYPRFATTDGPSHLYNAAIIGALRSGSWNGISAFFRLNPHLVPNWTTYFLLIQLMKVFPPASAEKVLVSGYFVLFALSFWWVLKQIRPDSQHFLIWGLVLGGNWFLSMGFYNFCYGLAFFLLCFGYWFKWRNSFGFGQWPVLFLLASLLYLSHFFCFLMTAYVIGVTSAFLCLGEVHENKERGTAQRSLAKLFFRRVVFPELCFLAFLFLNPLRVVGAQYTINPSASSKLAEILQHLSEHQGTGIFHLLLDSTGTLARVFILVVAAFTIVASYWTLRRSQEPLSAVSYGLAVFSVTCFAFYIFGGSDYSGTGLLRERAGWFGWWGIFAFLASRGWNRRGKLLVSLTATIACAANLLSGALWRHQVYPLLRTYDDVTRLVEPDRTMLGVCYGISWNTKQGLFQSATVLPLLHAGDITALAGRDIDVANYEGNGTSFPVEYLPEVNPAVRAPKVLDIELHPEVADLAYYEENTGRSIDYVLVWGEPDLDTGSGDPPLWGQLRARYTLIYHASAPSSLRLFQKEPIAASEHQDVSDPNHAAGTWRK